MPDPIILGGLTQCEVNTALTPAITSDVWRLRTLLSTQHHRHNLDSEWWLVLVMRTAANRPDQETISSPINIFTADVCLTTH